MTPLSDKATDQEVLQAAIDKAIDGGWRGDLLSDFYLESQPDGLVRVYWDNTEWSVLDVIFNHTFAQALWGEAHSMKRHKATRFFPEGSIHCTSCGIGSSSGRWSCWQYHIQQMAIAEDRIDYLRRHL